MQVGKRRIPTSPRPRNYEEKRSLQENEQYFLLAAKKAARRAEKRARS